MFRFQKLDVWHEAVAFAESIYVLTQHFPSDERFGLTSQMRRAAVSISSNIVEGTGRSSDIDFARFIEFAYGSLMEVTSQAHIGNRRGWISEHEIGQLLAQSEHLAKMLSGLRTSLLRKDE